MTTIPMAVIRAFGRFGIVREGPAVTTQIALPPSASVPETNHLCPEIHTLTADLGRTIYNNLIDSILVVNTSYGSTQWVCGWVSCSHSLRMCGVWTGIGSAVGDMSLNGSCRVLE